MVNGTGFTPTEQKILDLLLDGLKHSRHDVLKCLEDPTATANNLKPHLSHIRKKINPQGRDIVCRVGNGFEYQLVILIGSGDG